MSAPSSQLPERNRIGSLIGIWAFPYVLAACAYGLSFVNQSADGLRDPVLQWPIQAEVYGWLLAMVVLTGGWLIAEFFIVTHRETVVRSLQWDAVISALTAMIFTGIVGWYAGTVGIQWWLLVPWLAAVIDAFTSSWLGINNAAQKPFLSQRGRI